MKTAEKKDSQPASKVKADEDNNLQVDKSEYMIKFLMKENENLKKIMKDKISTNETLSALLSVLELQRERIDHLEEDNKLLSQSKEELLTRLKEAEFKVKSKDFYQLGSIPSFGGLNFIKGFSDLNTNQLLPHNKEHHEPLTHACVNTNSDSSTQAEYYKKKCHVLEENLIEMDQKYSKGFTYLKSKNLGAGINVCQSVCSRDSLKLNNRYDIPYSYDSIIGTSVNNINLGPKKKTLTPIIPSKSATVIQKRNSVNKK